MVPKNNLSRLPISAWLAESLRFIAFPVSASPIGDVNWWETLVGAQPDTSVVRPREGQRRVEGKFEKGKLVMQIQPARIDIGMIPLPDQEPTETGFLNIGPFEEALAPFSQVASRWLNLQDHPEIKRIAFGAALLYPVENRVVGYRQLVPYLHSVELDPENSSDLQYHINRFRNTTTAVAGLLINRLSRWSVAQVAMAGFVIEPTQISQEMTKSYAACRLELDMNTDAERREPLPPSETPLIFTELINLAKEIVVEGDIK